MANQISESDFASLREKCKIFEGDVLFSKTGSIGHVAIYNHSRPSASSQNIAVITPKLEDVNTEYLYCYLKSPLVQNIAQQSVKANAIPDLQLGIISKFTINLPPIVEQQEIVRRINALFLYAEVIEKIVQSAQKRVNLLTQSILAKAFSGELTAEWREQHQDLIIGINSAESLLAKIQAERILDAKNTKRPITRKKKQ
ncbi:restriction endonuclease subunit S [Acinetobacter bereziniae]|nr:restriction endonuclease subunit S [Acinetobacter bereziniae]